MVTLADRQYTLEDFHNISCQITLTDFSSEIQKKIDLLASMVGAPSYSKTPNFKKNRRVRHRCNPESWESIRNFKPTKIERKTEGIEKLIDDIILLLNKITKKNYKIMCNSIIKIMKNVADSEEENLIKLGESIFLIGSSNKFYTNLYSTLYKDLIISFPFMKEICIKNFKSFYSLFENIEYIKAEIDYDKFCSINKDNEKRRALGHFFINLMLRDIIDISSMIELIQNLIKKHSDYLQNKDNKNIIEEISENLFIMITSGASYLQKNPNWNSIYRYIYNISLLKTNAFPALTNKTIFKFMDIVETI